MAKITELPESTFRFRASVEIAKAARRGEWTLGSDDVIHEAIRRDIDLESLLESAHLLANARGHDQDPEIYHRARGVWMDAAWREGKYGDSRHGLDHITGGPDTVMPPER